MTRAVLHRTLRAMALAVILVIVTTPAGAQRRAAPPEPVEPPPAPSSRSLPESPPGQAGQELGDATARTDRAVDAIASHETGERLFREATFQGNGRTCGQCHVPADGFTITPQRVRDLFRENRDGPLFQLRDSNDGDGNRWTLVRRHGLFATTLPLHPSITVETDPSARTIVVRRAVPSLVNASLTAPHGWAGEHVALEDAVVACAGRFLDAGRLPGRGESRALARFNELLLSPARLAAWTPPLTVGGPPASSLPLPAETARRGQALFESHCASCHGGELAHRRPGSDGSPLYASVGISELNTHGLATHRLAFTGADGTTTVVATPDPGLAAVTGRLDDLNRFEVPSLRGVIHTAPYFHDHAAPDLDAVIDHYDILLGLGLDPGQRDDLRAYLESL